MIWIANCQEENPRLPKELQAALSRRDTMSSAVPMLYSVFCPLELKFGRKSSILINSEPPQKIFLRTLETDFERKPLEIMFMGQLMSLTLNGDSFKRDNCLLNRVGKKLERGMIALTVRWVRGLLRRFSQQGSPEVPVRGGPITPSSREPPHRLTLSWDSFSVFHLQVEYRERVPREC